MIKITIGENIKAIRKKNRMTQKELAILSGMSEGTIKQYETERRHPRIEQLDKIARVLKVSTYDLLDDGIISSEKFEKILDILEKYLAENQNKRDCFEMFVKINYDVVQFDQGVSVKDKRFNTDYFLTWKEYGEFLDHRIDSLEWDIRKDLELRNDKSRSALPTPND